jgi:hypothetical protein
MTTERNNLLIAPSLPPSLGVIYNSLTKESKRLFNRAFMFLWSYVLNRTDFIQSGGVLHTYYIIDNLRHKTGLTTSELAMMTYLYLVTDRGNKIIHCNEVYYGIALLHINMASRRNVIYDLRKKKYLARYQRDPSASPYLTRSKSRGDHPFIQMTPKGVDLIVTMNRDLYNIFNYTSFDDLTGKNKRPER